MKRQALQQVTNNLLTLFTQTPEIQLWKFPQIKFWRLSWNAIIDLCVEITPFSPSLLPCCSFLPSLLSQIAFPCNSPLFNSLQPESTATGTLLTLWPVQREKLKKRQCSFWSCATSSFGNRGSVVKQEEPCWRYNNLLHSLHIRQKRKQNQGLCA